jgi:hypothetical protein
VRHGALVRRGNSTGKQAACGANDQIHQDVKHILSMSNRKLDRGGHRQREQQDDQDERGCDKVKGWNELNEQRRPGDGGGLQQDRHQIAEGGMGPPSGEAGWGKRIGQYPVMHDLPGPDDTRSRGSLTTSLSECRGRRITSLNSDLRSLLLLPIFRSLHAPSSSAS